MSWNETTQAQHKRPLERFETDVTDAEWALVSALLPMPSRLGRPRCTDLREVLNAIQFMLGTGCQGRSVGSSRVTSLWISPCVMSALPV